MKRAISIVATIALGAVLLFGAACSSRAPSAREPISPPHAAEELPHGHPAPMPRHARPPMCRPPEEDNGDGAAENSEQEEGDALPKPGFPPKKPFPIEPAPRLPKPEL